MSRSVLLAAVVAAGLGGCDRKPLPASPTPPRDWADLDARYAAVPVGTPAAEVAGFLGKPGAALAGYSTQPVKRTPSGASGAVGVGESERYWASADGTGAVRVVFRTDGKARLVELLRITPMGPPPAPPPVPPVPDPAAP